MDHLVNGYLGEVAKWVDFQKREKLSNIDDFKEQYASTYAAIQSWKAVRDKKMTALHGFSVVQKLPLENSQSRSFTALADKARLTRDPHPDTRRFYNYREPELQDDK